MQDPQDWRARGILPAVIIIGIGVLFLLRNMDIVIFQDVWRFWPVLLIAAGLARMVDAHHSGCQLTGGIMIGAGGLLLANTLGFLHLNWHDFWPLILIGAGLAMLYQRLVPPRPVSPTSAGDFEGSLNDHAVFGGVDRKLTTADFRGGSTSAVFGGVQIDLRRSAMRGDSATVDVSTMFGGMEFKVPQNWLVVSQVTAIFGGVDNKCVEPDPSMPGVKRLFVKGSVIFGGIEFKN
ncbi:MAG: DUF5668 domain-containing protein [Candidatus Solibacter sp.]